METKRIITCLDVRDGRLTKGIKFEGNIDIGDPVETAKRYSQEGTNEIIFLDITASAEGRSVFLDTAKKVADVVTVPFCIGGGINSLEAVEKVLSTGAKKTAITSAAVKNPELIAKAAKKFGSQAICVGMDVKRVEKSAKIPSGFEIFINGGRQAMGLDAVGWAKECEKLGAGEIMVNAIDQDGVKEGYDLEMTRSIAEAVNIPIIASGGAGKPEHLLKALTEGKASAALVASIVHYGEYSLKELRDYLKEHGCKLSS